MNLRVGKSRDPKGLVVAYFVTFVDVTSHYLNADNLKCLAAKLIP